MTDPELVLEIERLSKTFPGQKALDDVSLDVRAGEIHALVGENGSGKSTLIKCLAGFHHPDPGSRISIAGAALELPYLTSEAIAAGCAFVHQDLALAPTLSIMENLALSGGFESGPLGRVRWRAQAKKARRLMALFGEHLDPRTEIARLSQADKTLVAIARALGDSEAHGRVLVLDEPTAALPAHEVEVLFGALRKLAATGIGMVYVSHRLTEVFDIADRVTILRDARKVGTYGASELDERKLIELIVGRPLEQYYPPTLPTAKEEVLLRVEGLAGKRLRGATFDVHAGEVLGFAGLLGSGRSELARLLFGAQQRERGEVVFKGISRAFASPSEAVESGIALIPQDRRGEGSHPELSVRENIMLVDLARYSRGGRLRRSAERRDARELIERCQVRPPRLYRARSTSIMFSRTDSSGCEPSPRRS
jgi:ribose transport system ATP-binding protein